MEGKGPGRPRIRWIDQIRKYIKIREKIGKKYKNTGSGTIEIPEDFSVIVDPCLWKQLKN